MTSTTKQQQQQQQVEHHGEEIKQESLKSTLQSAITDLEQEMSNNFEHESPAAAVTAPAAVVDKENMAPAQAPIPQVRGRALPI